MRIAGLLSWAIVAAVLLPAAATAQRAPYAAAAAVEARPLGQGQRLERRFLQITAENLRFQAAAARIVLARSTNPSVMELAASLVARHDALLPELLRLLHARSMAMPLPDSDHGKLLRQLGRLNGARLDRTFIDDVVLRTTQADLANHERLASLGDDPVLRAWVERQLPALRQQLADAGRRAAPAPVPAAATLRGHRAL